MATATKPLITYATLGILLLVFGVYSSTMQYANAISVVSVTFPAGSTSLDVTYVTGNVFSNNNDTTAYVIGANGGSVYVWKKSGSGITENTIIANATLTGSASARAIEMHSNTNQVFAVTNDKFWRLNSNPTVQLDRAEGIANSVRQLKYEPISGNMYFCTNDVFGTINKVTLAPTTLYTDPQTNGLLDCAFDDQFAYLSGIDIGSGFNADLIKIDLDTNTQVDSASVTNFGFGVCLDKESDFVWLTESSLDRVHKYDTATLTEQITPITVGTTPRFCAIADQDQARRLYVANEGTDNVSIIDIDANVVISTQTTCNQGVTTPRVEVKRLFNTTNYYQPCPEATNSIIVDDTVSEQIGEDTTSTVTICYIVQGSGQQFCKTYDVDSNGNVILDSVIGGVNPRNITDTSNDLFCSLGITDCDNTDITTNGTGMFMLLILIIISYAFVVAIHHFAHSPLSNINPMLVLLIGIVDITIAFFLGWIPDYIFYSVIVLLIGLGGFGLYRIIRGV